MHFRLTPLIAAAALLAAASCATQRTAPVTAATPPPPVVIRPAVVVPEPPPAPAPKPKSTAVVKTEEEWRRLLTPEQYRVTREGGTEAKFTGAYWDNREAGVYRCVCCGALLFLSEHKYDSGCGWPSYFQAAGRLGTKEDFSYGVKRTEVHCTRCGAHLGHLFNDGPKPGGQRYCINSAALKFAPKASANP